MSGRGKRRKAEPGGPEDLVRGPPDEVIVCVDEALRRSGRTDLLQSFRSSLTSTALWIGGNAGFRRRCLGYLTEAMKSEKRNA